MILMIKIRESIKIKKNKKIKIHNLLKILNSIIHKKNYKDQFLSKFIHLNLKEGLEVCYKNKIDKICEDIEQKMMELEDGL